MSASAWGGSLEVPVSAMDSPWLFGSAMVIPLVVHSTIRFSAGVSGNKPTAVLSIAPGVAGHICLMAHVVVVSWFAPFGNCRHEGYWWYLYCRPLACCRLNICCHRPHGRECLGGISVARRASHMDIFVVGRHRKYMRFALGVRWVVMRFRPRF